MHRQRSALLNVMELEATASCMALFYLATGHVAFATALLSGLLVPLQVLLCILFERSNRRRRMQ